MGGGALGTGDAAGPAADGDEVKIVGSHGDGGCKVMQGVVVFSLRALTQREFLCTLYCGISTMYFGRGSSR